MVINSMKKIAGYRAKGDGLSEVWRIEMSQWKSIPGRRTDEKPRDGPISHYPPVGLEYDKVGGIWGSQQDRDHVIDLL